jgi:hypothetical protein
MRKPTLRQHGRDDHAPLYRRNNAARARHMMIHRHYRLARFVTTGLPLRTTESTKEDKRVLLSAITMVIMI